MAARPVAHSVPEIEGQLGKLWARAAVAREEAAKAQAALIAAQTEAAARAAAALAAARETSDGGGHHVAARTSVLNLVVVAGDEKTAARCAATISATASRHASRSLILSAVDPDGPAGLDARIEALSMATADGRAETGAETIHVTAHGETGAHLASIIVPLLVHDLPVALWWPADPPFGSRRADRLLPIADRLIVDGSAWSGDGLEILGQLATAVEERRVVVADWALLRQARWREAVASVYDLPDLRAHLGAVRRICVEYSAAGTGAAAFETNVVRPLYHVAWLASRLGMTVVKQLSREGEGRRVATLRQKEHEVEVVLQPAASKLSAGSTVRVEITSRLRGAELVGNISADDHTVDVSILDDGRERVRRVYAAPRMTDIDLLARAVEEGAADPVAVHALATAARLLGVDSGSHNAGPRKGGGKAQELGR
ncbi:MAG TPA: glucose-6-phosphate dehydrogenase assembly protein OpcA [Candidatus Limnocylindrales bacterium]